MLPARARSPLTRSWLGVLAGLIAFLAVGAAIDGSRGLTRTAHSRGEELDARQTSSFDASDLEPKLAGRPEATIVWRGAWEAPRSVLYDLALESRGVSRWTIDGELAHQTHGDRSIRTVWLEGGFHRVEIVYEPDTASPRISVSAAPAGEEPRSIGSWRLKPRLPRNPRLRAAAIGIWRVIELILVLLTIRAIRRSVPVVSAWWRERAARAPVRLVLRQQAGRIAAWTCLALILTYAALLRVDLITVRYGPVTSPRWLAALQTRTVLAPRSIRPGTFPWVPAATYEHQDGPPNHYISDPYTYLNAARQMTSFYGAHYREPVFPFSVRMMLHLLKNQDVAVSFTSTLFSLIAVWLTYLLGAAFWSRPAGLAAALGLAIDREVIAHATLGWRDDAFVAAVVLATYMLLRCWRTAREPVRRVRVGPANFRIDAIYLEGIALGIAAGLAVLVRFMAFSFLLPAGLFIVLGMRATWSRRLGFAAVAVAAATVVSIGYFVNCWRIYGDPFYTFNIHGNVYRVAEGQQESTERTAAYVTGKFAARPFTMTETVVRGLTTYPFNNKWIGLESWWFGLGSFVSAVSLAGLILLTTLPSGRLLLVIGFTSLFPFAFTWRVDPNWRFTEHVYPLLLIAAAVFLSVVIRFVRLMLVPGVSGRSLMSSPLESSAPRIRSMLVTLAVVAFGAMLGTWLIARVLPSSVLAETLLAREDGMVVAGDDAAFLTRGWLDGVAAAGNVRLRVSDGDGVVALNLPEVSDYRIVFRLDPFPAPIDRPSKLPVVEFLLNGKSLATRTIEWNPERVGSYEISLPRAFVRQGRNELVVRLQKSISADQDAGSPGLSDGAAFAFWNVRLSLTPALPK